MAAAAEDSVAAVAEEVAAMAEAVEVDTAVAEMVGTAAAEVRWLTDNVIMSLFLLFLWFGLLLCNVRFTMKVVMAEDVVAVAATGEAVTGTEETAAATVVAADTAGVATEEDRCVYSLYQFNDLQLSFPILPWDLSLDYNFVGWL